MVKPRKIETLDGIQDFSTVADYDLLQRNMRDKGWLVTDKIIAAGIDHGHVLEIGPGPGYLGLEWLSRTQNTVLTGLDISQNMIDLAQKNAKAYGHNHRASYCLGNAAAMPFQDHQFDAVISNGSLHEWEAPERIFNEIHRVLKPSGKIFISDLRRDISFFIRCLFYAGTKPSKMRKGLTSSLQAAYTARELEQIVKYTALTYAHVEANPFGLLITGVKPV